MTTVKSPSSLNHLDESWGFHCQKVTAHLRNEAIDALDHDDNGMVVYRYLQCRRGQRVTRHNMMIWAPLVPYVAINAGNNVHFKHTKRVCKSRLTERYGADFVKQLQTMDCYLGPNKESLEETKDFSKVLELMRAKNIDTTNFEKAASEFFWQNENHDTSDDASVQISLAAAPVNQLAYEMELVPAAAPAVPRTPAQGV